MSERAAAFFDLDKTILAKSSSLAFAKPLYDGGLIGRSDVLKSAYGQLVYLTSGADHDQMERMRVYLSKLSAGWEVERVKAIVAETPTGLWSRSCTRRRSSSSPNTRPPAATSSSSRRRAPRSWNPSGPAWASTRPSGPRW